MKRKLVVIAIITLMLGALGGIGTYAWFTAQVTSSDNIYQLGTLELGKVSEIPEPLFVSNERFEGDSWVIGDWYPGKVVKGQGRILTIENNGSLPAAVYGISATLKDFNNPQNNPNAEDEFIKNMNIIVKSTISNKVYFQGTLEELLESKPQPLINDGKYIKLQNKDATYEDQRRVYFEFEAFMSTEADNDIQGVTADVDLIIHATQDNDEAVEALLSN